MCRCLAQMTRQKDVGMGSLLPSRQSANRHATNIASAATRWGHALCCLLSIRQLMLIATGLIQCRHPVPGRRQHQGLDQNRTWIHLTVLRNAPRQSAADQSPVTDGIQMIDSAKLPFPRGHQAQVEDVTFDWPGYSEPAIRNWLFGIGYSDPASAMT